MKKISLQEVKNLQKKIKTKKILKECIGDVFHVNGKECCWSGGTGKPNILIDGEWVEYDSLEDLQQAEQLRSFQKNIETFSPELEPLFEKLVFLGVEGLEVLNKKVEDFEQSVCENVVPVIDTGLTFTIWNNRADLTPNSGIKVGDDVFENIEDVIKVYHDDVQTQRDLLGLLPVISHIPANEIWTGCVLWNDLSTQTKDDEYLTIDTPETQYKFPVDVSNLGENALFGIVFNSRQVENNLTCNIDVDQIKIGSNYCLLSTDLQDSRNSMFFEEVIVQIDTFKKLQQVLRENPFYIPLIQNSTFQKFLQTKFSDDDIEELNVTDFVKEINIFVLENLKQLESSEFANAFNLIHKDPIMDQWRNSIESLQQILIEASDLFITLVSLYNTTVQIHDFIDHIPSSPLKESIQKRTLRLRHGLNSLKIKIN